MIPRLEHEADGRKYVLRGIRFRDQFALAEILRDRPDDGTGTYGVAHAQEHCEFWTRWNEQFTGLPCEPTALSWMLDVDGETVGMCQCRVWGTVAVVHYNAVHPDHRGQGYMTTMQLMLRTLIEPMGVTEIRFQKLDSAPQVASHAESRLGLTAVETSIGLTGQEVKTYEFTAERHKERLKDPKHADELIEVKVESVPTKLATPVDEAQPSDAQKKR